MRLSEKDRLVALAYLHQGKSPKEVEQLCPGISYAQALRLRKELTEAEETNSIRQLFDISEAAIDTLLESVQNQLAESVEILVGDDITLRDELNNLGNDIKESQILKAELAKAATTIVKRIGLQAATANSSETLKDLADALAKLQTAYFKTNNLQIANFNDSTGFEKFLKP